MRCEGITIEPQHAACGGNLDRNATAIRIFTGYFLTFQVFEFQRRHAAAAAVSTKMTGFSAAAAENVIAFTHKTSTRQKKAVGE